MTQPKPSKTERKKEQQDLQRLGEQLIELTAEDLRTLPIDERLREAVLAASKIRAHGALRRQKQLIGKLMRNCDPEPIRRALEARSAEDRQAKRLFADAERWRARIADEGEEAVQLFCAQHGAPRGPFIELLERVRSAPSERIEKGLRRQLFREIHNALMAAARDDRISR